MFTMTVMQLLVLQLLLGICGISAQIFQFQISSDLFRIQNDINFNPVNQDPEVYMTTVEIIKNRGYPVETHTVQTQDGYILEIHRIPYGKSGPKTEKRFPIFLQHGLLSSSFDWVVNFGNQSLGYMLADVGYDVWLGNFRGNTYSRNHTTYNPQDAEFWKFSWDEMAEFDLPAMIDYVLRMTGFNQLTYIGHSMGTTTFFALMSTKTEYNSKIKTMIGLAPVATVGNVRSPLIHVAPFVNQLEFIFYFFGFNEFLPSNYIIEFLASSLCAVHHPIICENAIFVLVGFDLAQLNTTRLPVYVSHDPAGTSTKNIAHYLQMMNSKKFVRFDYGPTENMKRYNQTTPPEYDVNNVVASTALFYSDNDYLADPKDVMALAVRIPNLLFLRRIEDEKFSHLDFLIAKDAERLQNTYLVDFLKSRD